MSFVTRATPLGDGRPLTLDESARSVEVVASTQAPRRGRPTMAAVSPRTWMQAPISARPWT